MEQLAWHVQAAAADFRASIKAAQQPDAAVRASTPAGSDAGAHQAEQQLAALLAGHSALTAAVRTDQRVSGLDADEAEELRAACSRRGQALDSLAAQLDSCASALRAQLDQCHELLRTPAVAAAPKEIVQYAHRLRYSFAPLGVTPGMVQVPPAPQTWDMLASTLTQFNRARQQQQAEQVQQQQAAAAAAAAAAMPAIPADWKPGDAIPADFLAAMAQQGTGVPGATAQAAAAQAAAAVAAAAGQAEAAAQEAMARPHEKAVQPTALAFGLDLNADLDLGEQVEEEYSEEEDYSDDG